MIYTYFVSFAYQDGFGNSAIDYEKKIDTYEDIVKIQKCIKRKNKIGEAAILYYQLLNKRRNKI